MKTAAITFDCADPQALAQWWAAATGGSIVKDLGEFVFVAQGDGPNLGFQRVSSPNPGKNRLHLDFGSPDRDAEVERLVGLGARRVDEHQIPGAGFEWTVLADPDGNEFCVANRMP